MDDLRHAVRALARAPGFTAIAVATLALGIGANTALFSVARAVLLRPLPYLEPERLALVWSAFGSEERAPASGPELAQLRRRSRAFEDLAGIWVTTGALTGWGEPEQVRVGQVTANFLSLLGPAPAHGRTFVASEEGPGAAPALILSDGLWRRRFAADPGILGRSVVLDGDSRTVVGVMGPDFRMLFPEDAGVPVDVQAFIPFAEDLASAPRDLSYVRTLGRLRRGVTWRQAQAEADALASGLRSEFALFREQNLGLKVVPLPQDAVRAVRPALLVLSGGVGLLLLIAGANVASLLLARAADRRNDLTLRAALGAAPPRLLRLLLTESAVLAGLGGVAALAVGRGLLAVLLALRPAALTRLGTVRLDLAVLGFTFGLAAVAGLLAGLAPAVGAARVNLGDALKQRGRGAGARLARSRGLLLATEAALGVVLLIGAGLLARTFVGLLQVDPGFEASRVLTFQVSLPDRRYPKDADRIRLLERLQKRLAAMPGVRSLAATSHLPFDAELPNWYSYFWKEGASAAEQSAQMADHRAVLPGFFECLGATRVSGRTFDEFDMQPGRAVVVVDDLLARRTWPDANPIGQKLNVERIADAEFVRGWAEVVGVVRHVRSHSLADLGRGQVYLPYSMAPRAQMTFAVRASEPSLGLADAIRREVAGLDPDLPVARLVALRDYVDAARTQTRFTTVLAGVMAGIALLLALVGTSGLTSYWVSRRTGEIGIRIALGAQRADIVRLVLAQSLAPVACGSIAGALLSLALTPLLSSLLFAVRPLDPATWAAAISLLLAGTLLASWGPARRATGVEPTVALRRD